MGTSIELDRVGHLLRIGASVTGHPYQFLLDSGAGISVVAPWVAEVAGSPTGRTVSGRRMSGQEVTAPLIELAAVELGGFRRTDFPAGVLDMDPDADKRLDGILGLDIFSAASVTIDPQRGCVTIDAGQAVVDDAAPVDAALVPAETRRAGHVVEMFVPLALPSGRVVRALVDTGAEPSCWMSVSASTATSTPTIHTSLRPAAEMKREPRGRPAQARSRAQ